MATPASLRATAYITRVTYFHAPLTTHSHPHPPHLQCSRLPRTRSPPPSPPRPTPSTVTRVRGTATTSTASSTPGALSLPRNLARAPALTDIPRDALLAVAPELSGVSAELIRHSLRAKAP
ncbi:hypothetical protein DFH09DRAFT_1312290 [Mycena vulgaris]|nr:hypothetical protein DFH09DRAFT_1312290 [Mycena vulgaris]